MSLAHATFRRQFCPIFEQLEDRITPASSDILVPAFYRDLLFRQPDFPAAQVYADELDAGRRPAVVAYEIETAPNKEVFSILVQTNYVNFLNRRGSTQEMAGFVNGLAAGASDQAVAATILGSEEYFKLQGSNNAAWANAVYQDLLGRPNSEGAFVLDHLDHGVSRQLVAGWIADSQEACNVLVLAFYQQYLRRSGQGDAGAVGYASQLFRKAMSNEQMIAEILGSQEYLAFHTPPPPPPSNFSANAFAFGTSPLASQQAVLSMSATLAGPEPADSANFTPNASTMGQSPSGAPGQSQTSSADSSVPTDDSDNEEQNDSAWDTQSETVDWDWSGSGQ